MNWWRDLKLLLLRLAIDPLDDEARRDLSGLTLEEREKLFRAAHWHRVLVPLGRAAQEIGVSMGKVEKTFLERDQLHEDLSIEQVSVARDLHRCCQQVAFIKGFATESCYSPWTLRQAHDLDILVGTQIDFWSSLAILAQKGYQSHSLVCRCDPITNCWSFVTRLTRPRPTGPYPPFRIDLHGGAYPIYWGSSLKLDPDFWENLGPVRKTDGALGPSPAAALMFHLIESLDRPFLMIRDLVDIYHLEKLLTSECIERVLSIVATEHLGVELTRLQAGLRMYGGLARLTSGDSDGWRSQLWKLCARLWTPLKTAVGHDYHRERIRNGPIEASAIAFRNLRFQVYKNLREGENATKFLAWTASRRDARQSIIDGIHTEFVFVAPHPSGEIGWIERAAGPLLRTPVGTFLPISFGLVNEGHLIAAMSDCEKLK